MREPIISCQNPITLNPKPLELQSTGADISEPGASWSSITSLGEEAHKAGFRASASSVWGLRFRV